MMRQLEGATFGIYVPSYKRAATTTTYKLLEYYTYVVRKSEEAEYRRRGISNIWAIDDELIDSFVKVANYINDNAPEDIICQVDDDIKNFCYRIDTSETLEDKETVTAELERIGQIVIDLEIGFAFISPNAAIYNYRAPFNFTGISGPMRMVNKKIYKSRFSEEAGFSCDLDVVLNELLLNRIILQAGYFAAICGIDTNSGGNSENKKKSDKDAAYTIMKQKWGKYFQLNERKNKPTIKVER